MKRFKFGLCLMLVFCCLNACVAFGFLWQKDIVVYAEDGLTQESVVVYDQDKNKLCEKSGVEVGDKFVTTDFCEYEIVKIDGKKAYAKKMGCLQIPKIKRESFNIQKSAKKGKICLYMTHNDESYVPSDGYDSVYGAGGIHDVAKALKAGLENKGIDIVLDETLHIPHNSSAYSRSSVTANKLLNNEFPDAMFDIHRDGVSKKYYETKQNGQNLSKIRIVVGKSNPNFDDNYEFARHIFAIGNSMYPWLFSDIYCGKGHYNQVYQNTDLLFEMGTYLIEKEAVLGSLPYLAEVIDAAMYQSIVEDNGDIVVDESCPSSTDSPIVAVSKQKKMSGWSMGGLIYLGVASLTIIGAYTYKSIKKKSKGYKF